MIQIINEKNSNVRRISYSAEGQDYEAYLLFELKAEEKQAYVMKTFVDENFRGQGIARVLVEALVDYCREHQLEVLSVCSYVTTLMRRKDEWKDLLLEGSTDNSCSI